MANQIIENYITTNYNRWLGWAQRLCIRRRISTQHAQDILQDTLLTISQKRSDDALIEMLSAYAHKNYTLFDLFVNRCIHNKIGNIGRHIWCIKQTITDVDISLIKIPVTEQYSFSI